MCLKIMLNSSIKPNCEYYNICKKRKPVAGMLADIGDRWKSPNCKNCKKYKECASNDGRN